VQRPIPIWLGGQAEPVLKRVGQLADGWLPNLRPGPESEPIVERVRGYAREVGRDPATIGLQGSMGGRGGPEADWPRHALAWKQFGASHLTFNTMYNGYTSPQQHIDAIRRFASTVMSEVGS
jgi:hypothetical protein